MTEDQIRDLFREMRETPVPPDSLVRVRAGIEARLRRRMRTAAAWVLAAAAVVMMGIRFRPVAVAPAPVQVASLSTPDVSEATTPKAGPPPVRRAVQKARRVVHAAPVLIEIETPDPDVVIRLIGD